MTPIPQSPPEHECPRGVLAANVDDPRFAAVEEQRVGNAKWTASSALGANLTEPIDVAPEGAPLFVLDILYELIAAAGRVLVNP